MMVVVNVGWLIVTYRLTRSLFWRAFVTIFMAWQILALIAIHSRGLQLAYRPKGFLVAIMLWNNAAFVCSARPLLPSTPRCVSIGAFARASQKLRLQLRPLAIPLLRQHV